MYKLVLSIVIVIVGVLFFANLLSERFNNGIILDSKPSIDTPNDSYHTFLVCIGMSNAFQQCEHWIRVQNNALSDQINSDLIIINCAVGSHAIERWNNESYDDLLWNSCDRQLKLNNISNTDNVYVWHKAAMQFLTEYDESGTRQLLSSEKAYESLLVELSTFSERIVEKMPYVSTVFVSGRSYGGFATNIERGEPYSYENNLAINEWVQNNPSVKGVMYMLGPSLWGPNCANATNLSQFCYQRSDYSPDGVHMSMQGRSKVVRILNEFFIDYEWYSKE